MPLLRAAASDATALVKALAQYVPAGRVAKISKPSRDIYPVVGLGALARASRIGSLLSPTTTVLAVTSSSSPASRVLSKTLPWVSNRDCFVAKYASDGEILWAARITGTTSDDVGLAITTDTSGNTFVTGSYSNASVILYNADGTAGPTLTVLGSGGDCFIAKYTPDGVVSWAVRIAGDTTLSGDSGRGIVTDASGNVFVTGSYGGALTLYSTDVTTKTLPLANGSVDGFAAKYSPTGVAVWAIQMTGAVAGGDEAPFGIAIDTSGNLFVTGTYTQGLIVTGTDAQIKSLGQSGSTDCFLIKISPSGVVTWATRIIGGGEETGYEIAVDTSGNVFVTGTYNTTLQLVNADLGNGPSIATSTGTIDTFVAKYNTSGTGVWVTRISSASADVVAGIATDTSGNIFVTGYYGALLTAYGTDATTKTLAVPDGNDIFIVKYTPTGVVSWATRISSTGVGTDFGFAVATDVAGNVIVTGAYGAQATVYGTDATTNTLPFTGVQDCFLVKYSPTGVVSWATRIASTGSDRGNAVATDASSNIVVTGNYGAALTLYSSV